MEEVKPVTATYNLWNEAWIGLECRDGRIERAGIGQVLARAHEYLSIYDPSPLVVVSIHRLLAAILQAALKPQSKRYLELLWEQGRFPEPAVEAFCEQYAGRFDLFSAEAPFLQSADLGLKAAKGEPVKTVAYLMPELPARTAVTHFRHKAVWRQGWSPFRHSLHLGEQRSSHPSTACRRSISCRAEKIYSRAWRLHCCSRSSIHLQHPDRRIVPGGNEQHWWDGAAKSARWAICTV